MQALMIGIGLLAGGWGQAAAQSPFEAHGSLRVAAAGTFLEHADGTPFFFLADTCWTGPALSSEADWATYLADRKAKGFTAIQFNMVSPWRAAPADADGEIAYRLADGRLSLNEKFYARLDARFRAVNAAGLLAVPVLCWAHKQGDAGIDLNEAQLTELVRLQLARYQDAQVLWILAGDNRYTTDTEMWKRIGRKVFGEQPRWPVTTHPTGENFPWSNWEDETWLTVLGYQSGHGDSEKTLRWLTNGPPRAYGERTHFTRPLINLEPPYEDHNGYTSRKPHTAASVRRAMYWSLLIHPTAGVTYGGHGVWSWHTRPGEHPTDHNGSGVARVWSDALHLPAAGQMRHLRRFFESVAWTELRPAQTLLAQQPGDQDPATFIACAATPDRRQIVVYLPVGGSVSLKLEPNRVDKLTWFNPRTGERMAGNPHTMTAPDREDWLLLVDAAPR